MTSKATGVQVIELMTITLHKNQIRPVLKFGLSHKLPSGDMKRIGLSGLRKVPD